MRPSPMTHRTTRNVGFSDSVEKSTREEILNLLNDPRGWSGVVGHRFSEHEPCEVLWIMESDRDLRRRFRAHPELHGLSVTDRRHRPCRIYLNKDNWTSPPRAFRGSRSQYRAYLVQHEAGHAFFGLDHLSSSCPTTRCCCVMSQQTRSTDGCSPNPWVTICDRRLLQELNP